MIDNAAISVTCEECNQENSVSALFCQTQFDGTLRKIVSSSLTREDGHDFRLPDARLGSPSHWRPFIGHHDYHMAH